MAHHPAHAQDIPLYSRFFHYASHDDFSESAQEYRGIVSRLAGRWPGLSYLNSYLQERCYLSRTSFPIALIKFKRNTPVQGPDLITDLNLQDLLKRIDDDSDKLVVLEDPTPKMIAELGGRFKIDPQFWADFLVEPSWFGSGKLHVGGGQPQIPYRDDSLLEQLWPLPSSALSQQHISFRFVAHVETKGNCEDNQFQSYRDASLLSKIYPLADDARAGPPSGAESKAIRRIITIWQNQDNRHPTGSEVEPTTPWLGQYLCLERDVLHRANMSKES